MTRKKQHILLHIRDRLTIVHLPFILATAILLLAIGGSVAASLHRTESIGTVTGKEVKNYNNKGIYMVYVQADDGTYTAYTIQDSLIPVRFNSSDLYGSIEIGSKYEFKLKGYRIPLLSAYPNILEASKVTD